ncbi:MAG: methionine adenosyltransferase [Clostridiales bacterium]|jgi:S-adenosylmethionine synthetase|nr:methionine adenosyltransferase [Clostridiales bacterium]MBQ4217044.1 methionine adenosyltransferase [Clostridiales bacterium]MBQ7628369.1 methionine adenosyltransferase [Clostridiales bacterium]
MRNRKGKWLFTSESVTEGHPDKVCDQVSDSILDAILEQDPTARVACETCATTGMVLVMGEISTSAYVDIPSIVRGRLEKIGYDSNNVGFDYKSCSVLTSIDEQSADIAMGVDKSYEAKRGDDSELDTGAGDQGMMFGYANDDTPEFMPMPIALSHRLSKRLSDVRKTGGADFLRPDGKSQVTVEYENDKVKRIDAIVVSTQHSEDISEEDLEKYVKENVIAPVVPEDLIDENTKIYVNPTGRFVIGGPAGDSGLTGRKIIVDTYGGFARHGGGAFSGKDPTKVDRSASYMMRYVAKNIVAAGLARECEVQVAYAIGVAKPVSVSVDTFGTGVISDEKITEIVNDTFDLRPAAIIRDLDLRRPIYADTASYGHFGRLDVDLPWERTDKIETLRSKAGI